MALQLLAPAVLKIGDPIAMSVTNSTPEVDTYVEYDFQKGGVSVYKSATPAYAKAKAALSDAGVWTVVGKKDDEDGTLVTSQPITMVVNKLDMTVSVSITPASKTILSGETVNFASNLTGLPSAGTVTYAWYIDGAVLPSETKSTLAQVFPDKGSKSITCKATCKATDYNDITVTSNSSSITINNKQFTNTAEIRLDKTNYKVGDKITATAWINNPVQGTSASYSWVVNGEVKDDLAETAEFTSTKTGTVTFAVSILLQKDGYDAKTITATQGAIITDGNPVEPEDLNYVHSLPWRESAYLWMGWWVFYEIQKAVAEGIDWKTDQSKLKYGTDLKTLAWMLDNYPNVEVQESKNGYILDKSTIESGYIY